MRISLQDQMFEERSIKIVTLALFDRQMIMIDLGSQLSVK